MVKKKKSNPITITYDRKTALYNGALEATGVKGGSGEATEAVLAQYGSALPTSFLEFPVQGREITGVERIGSETVKITKSLKIEPIFGELGTPEVTIEPVYGKEAASWGFVDSLKSGRPQELSKKEEIKKKLSNLGKLESKSELPQIPGYLSRKDKRKIKKTAIKGYRVGLKAQELGLAAQKASLDFELLKAEGYNEDSRKFRKLKKKAEKIQSKYLDFVSNEKPAGWMQRRRIKKITDKNQGELLQKLTNYKIGTAMERRYGVRDGLEEPIKNVKSYDERQKELDIERDNAKQILNAKLNNLRNYSKK